MKGIFILEFYVKADPHDLGGGAPCDFFFPLLRGWLVVVGMMFGFGIQT